MNRQLAQIALVLAESMFLKEALKYTQVHLILDLGTEIRDIDNIKDIDWSSDAIAEALEREEHTFESMTCMGIAAHLFDRTPSP
jgi:hypothetical protein